MDFVLSEDLLIMQETVRRLAREVVAPLAGDIDLRGSFPEDLLAGFQAAGLPGIAYPEDYGGGGLGLLGLCLAVEEVAKYCCSSGVILLLTRLPGGPILYGGTEAQKQKYLRGIAEGRLKGAFCNTEPAAGSDSAGIRTMAQKEGDHYVLNGVKAFVWGARLADFFVISARTDPSSRHGGISMFVVDKGAPGLSVGKSEQPMGVRGIPLSEVVLTDCRIGAQNLLGLENRGFRLLMWSLNSVRPVVAALGLGLAQGALQYALEYTRQRHAFGKPVAQFQGTRWKAATLATEIQAARWLIYHAATLIDQGLAGKEHAPYLSMAKLFATELAVRASSEALQMLGGCGYTSRHPLERFCRDARQLTIVEGTSEIQREIIGRAVVGGTISYT